MPKYTISGYATCSVVAEVEAKDEAEARKKAAGLDVPSVYTNHHANTADGSWHFNEFDDMPADAIRDIEES